MVLSDTLEMRWLKLQEFILKKFGNKPDLESVLFLIGLQETGITHKKLSKEQKVDVMHVAVCTIFSLSGYFQKTGLDEEGWPHFSQLVPLPKLSAIEQDNFMKDHILLYFHNNEIFF